MRDIFSFPRFWRLLVKHTSEHYRAYGMSAGVLAGVLILCGLFLFAIAPDALDPGFQGASYVLLLWISGGIFTSTVFTEYGEKTKAIPALTLPATSFEKFLIGWVFSYPVFMVVYTAVFYLALMALSSFWRMPPGRHFMMFNVFRPEIPVFWVLFTVIHSLSLFGAVFFKKLQFIKTGFIFFIALVLVVFCNTLFLKGLTGVDVEKIEIPFGFFNFYTGDRMYSVGTSETASLLVIVLLLVVAITIWVAAYFRLKEKQV
ncbi:MAG TPA: hypothetical protein VN616_13300 [Puia sp.]|nr:hypothetical protein [Puia sp.]